MVTANETLISVKGLKKHFGKLQVLKGVDIDIHSGEVVVVIGPSGSGKSTFLRCINLLETPSDGHILFHGQDMAGRHTNAAAYRAKVGMVFQSFNLFNNMTVLQNCMVGQIKVLKKKPDEAREMALRYLRQVGMAPYINARPQQLSGGQKQRVAIATALVSERKVLVLDEPTSGLDLQHMKEVADELITIQEMGKTSLVITHDYELIVSCCTHVLHLEHGVVQEQYALDATGFQLLKNFFIESR